MSRIHMGAPTESSKGLVRTCTDIHQLMLNERKEVWGFWVREASSGKVSRESMAHKGCLVGFVRLIKVDFFSTDKFLKSPSLPGMGEEDLFTNDISLINVNFLYKRKACGVPGCLRSWWGGGGWWEAP